MKNCPNCGTLITDNENKCYNCGTDLSQTGDKGFNDDGFADNFFAQIGGAVPTAQNNVENTASENASTASIGDAATPGVEGQKSSDSFTSIVNSINTEEPVQQTSSYDLFSNMSTGFDPNKQKTEEVAEIKVQTITAEDVDDEDDPLFHEKEKKKIKVSKSFIFNTCCFVVFIGIMIFVYFQFVNNPKDEILSLGGLTYKLDDKFVLTTEDQGSRLYSYQNNGCDLRVTYGAASSDSYIESWFNTVKETFKDNENYTFQNEELSINDNKWSSLTIMEMPNGNLTAPALRYKYSTIVHRGNFYQVVFVNLNGDETCLEMYNEFSDTLKFE